MQENQLLSVILLFLFIIYVKSQQKIWYSMKFPFATKIKISDSIFEYYLLLCVRGVGGDVVLFYFI